MTRALCAAVAGTLVALALGPDRPQAAQRAVDPTVPQLLAASGRYIADYESSFGAVIAEERCEQTANSLAANGTRRRVTVGDVLIFNSGGAGWMAFRDVRITDNDRLPTKPGRLAALVANPTHDGLAEAMRATAVSATFAIGTIAREPAIPMTALMYLRASRQSLGIFELDGVKTISDIRVAVLKFRERPHARMTTADDAAVTGRFWIVPETGRVVQTELIVTSGTYESTIEVRYANRPEIAAWVPVRLFERHNVAVPSRNDLGRGGASVAAYVDGLATYEMFRKFELRPGLVVK